MTKMELFDSLGAEMNIEFDRNDKYFLDDDEPRNVYRFTISYNGKEYSAEFGDSLANTAASAEPSPEDVLECLTWYPCGEYHDFCGDYGYDEGWTDDELDALADQFDEDGNGPEMGPDNCKTYKIYDSVKHEYEGLLEVFGEEIMEEFAQAE